MHSKRLSLSELSTLKCDFLEYSDAGHVLVVKFTGEYGVGSLGNGDGTYIAAQTLAGAIAFSPGAILIDFSEMSYEWGNTLLLVFQEIAQHFHEEGEVDLPVHVLAGEKSEAALRSLMSIQDDAEWFHLDLEEAVRCAQKAASAWLDC